MPAIACPGCGKQYKVSAAAAGQVAKCSSCGKRFRLGAARSPATDTKPTPAKKTPTASPSPPPTKPTAPVDDDLWDEVLNEQQAAKPREAPIARQTPTSPAGAGSLAAGQPTPQPPQPQAKRRKKKVRWGFQWEKVAGGAATFLVAGGITLALLVSTDRIYFWPAGIAVLGFFTMLSGLMGEEGIW